VLIDGAGTVGAGKGGSGVASFDATNEEEEEDCCTPCVYGGLFPFFLLLFCGVLFVRGL